MEEKKKTAKGKASVKPVPEIKNVKYEPKEEQLPSPVMKEDGSLNWEVVMGMVPENRKLSYLQLEETAMQLNIQGQRLATQIEQMKEVLADRRLEFLLKIMETSVHFENEDFIRECEKEVISYFTPKEEEQQQES